MKITDSTDLSKMPDNTSAIGELKRKFFAYRNGIVADTLRKAGLPHKVIFGLQIPQISAIARETGTDSSLGKKLWLDRECREARLLACCIIDVADISVTDAVGMALDCRSREETDWLCFRLLKRLPQAEDLALELAASPKGEYAATALRRNLDA